MIRFAAVAAAICFAPMAWAVNKCTAADGRVVYQEAPCPSDAKASRIGAEPKPQAGAYESLKASCGGKLPGLPEVGWTEGRFLTCTLTGAMRAFKVNETTTASGTLRQYVLRAPGFYVYAQDGKITAVQGAR